VQWLNPQDFPSLDKFQEAYNLAYSKSKAYETILKLLEESEQRAATIRVEMNKDVKNFGI
jgi:hypothetical protein